MILIALVAIPLISLLLAFWLWWPVHGLSRRSRRWHVGLSLLFGLLLPAQGVIWRMHVLDDAGTAWLQLLFGWMLLSFLLVLLLVLLRDALWLPARLLRAQALRGWLHGIGLNRALVALALALSTLGVFNGLKPPQVHERELAVQGLPAELDGLRVAVLADIHASAVKGAWRTRRIVADVLAAKPDLIVLPGDMVDGQVASNAVNVDALAELHAPHGVWLAPGNHEYYSNYTAWMAHFRQLGLGVLENQTAKLAINGRTLAVSGIGDLAYYQRKDGLAPDLARVVQQAAGSDFHILLAHQPKQARATAAASAVNLQISGHTHGGHIVGMDRWVVAPSNDGYVRGDYRLGAMTLFVSPGAGQWDGFSARLGVPSSIDILVLRRAQG